jgi:RNA polymerase sigma-70 factor, ECF subfamily
VESTSPQAGDLALPRPSAAQLDLDIDLPELPKNLLSELGLTRDEFRATLQSIGIKFNYGLPPAVEADSAQKMAFLRSLRLEDLALATACALGREMAWQRFLVQYRTGLTQAAIAITGSATLGHDLADSLYSELFGLRAVDGERRSPLASYSGRGSLLGWLRTTLAQRHVDHHRRTHRETPLDELDAPAPAQDPAPAAGELSALAGAVTRTIEGLSAEDRFFLASYYLDRQPLAQIGRLLHVHEATISRRLKRLVGDVRKQLLRELQSDGLSKRAAEEALGSDPRDLEINLRSLLQSSQTATFPDKTAS